MQTNRLTRSPRITAQRRTQVRPAARRAITKLRWPVVLLAAALYSTFLSPQISILGRGFRSTLPLLAAFGIVCVLLAPAARPRLTPLLGTSLFGAAFVALGLLRNSVDPDVILLENHVLSPAVCVVLWMTVIFLRRWFPESVGAVRWLALLTLGVSLGLGIPKLIEEPGIARLTMSESTEGSIVRSLHLSGVANYSWYTPVACTWPVIANWLINLRRSLWVRMMGWALLTAASAAVVFSTFTMAVVWLVAGIAAVLLLVALAAKNPILKTMALLAIVSALYTAPRLYDVSLNLESTEFSALKAARLITGTLEEGFIAGDETGRGHMLVDTLTTFSDHPLLGVWGFERYFYFGGHSSWADTLALQGIVGALLWLLFLSFSWRKRRLPISMPRGVAGGTLSWMLLGLGGIFNPTLFSQAALLLVWLFDDGGQWKAPADLTEHTSSLVLSR